MATPRVTIDQLPDQATVEDTNYIIVQDTGVTKKLLMSTLRAAPSPPLADHIADTTDAHAASSISTAASGTGVDGTTVQAQLGQLTSLVNTKIDQTAADVRYVNLAGDTMTGPFELAGAPTIPTHAATKQYVDDKVIEAGGGITQPEADARYVNIDGDTMTGPLTVDALITTGTGMSLPAGEPSAADRAARKDYVDSIRLAAWPIGSVFISVVPTNPATLLGGGTWVAFAKGRMLVGLDTADASFDTPEEQGGAKTLVLATANLPSHTHAIDHNHATATSGAASATAHTHTIDHNHATATTSNHAGHQHGGWFKSPFSGTGGGYVAVREVDNTAGNTITTSGGAHTHTVDLPAFTGSSGSAGAAHTHSIDLPAYTGASGAAGSGTAIDKLPPYIVTYMWKRTA